jgi:nucleotide-binding universal stress UspA family protein
MWSESHVADEDTKRACAEQALNELLGQLPASIQAEARISKAPLGDSILYLASRLPADLIVLATHGRPTAEHEAVTERVLARATCPILTTRDAGDQTVLPDLGPGVQTRIRVLVPVDDTEHSVQALSYAFGLSKHLPFYFELVCVEGRACWDDLRYATHFNIQEHRTRRMEAARERLRKLVPPELVARTNIEILLGQPATEIIRCAGRKGIQLIVMGTHSKRPLARLFTGATSCSILYESNCPVWFVPEMPARSRSRLPARVAALAS